MKTVLALLIAIPACVGVAVIAGLIRALSQWGSDIEAFE